MNLKHFFVWKKRKQLFLLQAFTTTSYYCVNSNFTTAFYSIFYCYFYNIFTTAFYNIFTVIFTTFLLLLFTHFY